MPAEHERGADRLRNSLQPEQQREQRDQVLSK
jgi:hypothetical protein